MLFDPGAFTVFVDMLISMMFIFVIIVSANVGYLIQNLLTILHSSLFEILIFLSRTMFLFCYLNSVWDEYQVTQS